MMMTWKLQLRGLLRWVHSVIECLRMVVASAVVLAPVACLAWWSSCSCFALPSFSYLLIPSQASLEYVQRSPALQAHSSLSEPSGKPPKEREPETKLDVTQIMVYWGLQGSEDQGGLYEWAAVWAGSRPLVHRAPDWVPVNASYRGQIWSVCLI